MEMLIKNAVVVSPADKLNEKTDILIKDGVIAKIGSGITSVSYTHLTLPTN